MDSQAISLKKYIDEQLSEAKDAGYWPLYVKCPKCGHKIKLTAENIKQENED